MVNTSANAKLSISNVLSIVDNSIKILLDTDDFLSKEGWQPVHGNTIGSEHSKSIRQTPTDLGRFLPNFMSRFYYRHREPANVVLAVNIQLHHPRHPELEPSIWGATLALEDFYTNKPPANLYYWLVKNAIFETDHNPTPNGPASLYKGEGGPSITFFGVPLMDIKSREELRDQVVVPLLKSTIVVS